MPLAHPTPGVTCPRGDWACPNIHDRVDWREGFIGRRKSKTWRREWSSHHKEQRGLRTPGHHAACVTCREEQEAVGWSCSGNKTQLPQWGPPEMWTHPLFSGQSPCPQFQPNSRQHQLRKPLFGSQMGVAQGWKLPPTLPPSLLAPVHPPARPHQTALQQSVMSHKYQQTRSRRGDAANKKLCNRSKCRLLPEFQATLEANLCWNISKSWHLPFAHRIKFGSLQTSPASPIQSFRS